MLSLIEESWLHLHRECTAEGLRSQECYRLLRALASPDQERRKIAGLRMPHGTEFDHSEVSPDSNPSEKTPRFRYRRTVPSLDPISTSIRPSSFQLHSDGLDRELGRSMGSPSDVTATKPKNSGSSSAPMFSYSNKRPSVVGSSLVGALNRHFLLLLKSQVLLPLKLFFLIPDLDKIKQKYEN